MGMPQQKAPTIEPSQGQFSPKIKSCQLLAYNNFWGFQWLKSAVCQG